MSQIIPPLTLYYYSPVSPHDSSAGTSSQNNSFYNQSNTPFSIASAISLFTIPTSFDKNAYTHSYNAIAPLYSILNNGVLSSGIGNLITKSFSLKINPNNLIYDRNGLFLIMGIIIVIYYIQMVIMLI